MFPISTGNTGPPPPFSCKVPSSRSTDLPPSSSRNVPSTGSVGPPPPFSRNDSFAGRIDPSPPSSVPSEPAYIPSREWGLWAKLKGKETGLGWDPIKKTIQASDDWWNAKIQENPDVTKFREEGPKHLDEIEFLFEDVVATGVGAWAPSEDINDSYNDRYNDEDNGNEKEGLEDELNDESTPSSAMRQKRRKVGKGSGASQLSTQLERIINVFEEEKANEIAYRNNVPSISTCLTVLKQLPGLEVGSDIFFIATRLMAKRSNREIFMGLEDSALQLGWLKTHSLADVSGS
ncbi:L10-interacting MYB domain-containing protein [Arachis hypogaea]|nr:L10-interacting MYB domain-containing protein [Arachis hypogaea]